MMSIVILGIIFIIALVVGGLVWAVRQDEKDEKSKNKKGLIKKQAEEKAEHKKKILDMLSSRDRIANKDVEKGLNVSDATATRYLDELEKEGIIRQVGTDGQYVYYKKV